MKKTAEGKLTSREGFVDCVESDIIQNILPTSITVTSRK